MATRSKLGLGVVAATAATASVLAIAPSAQAEPASVGRLALPGCIWAEVQEGGWTDTLVVHNECGEAMRVKVVLDFAKDNCLTAPAGVSRGKLFFPARFNRLDDC